MGSAISKKCKHKGKLKDKETWTGEEGGDQESVVAITTADAGNQCVLQWIQKMISDEHTNLDDRPPKRPHSETCLHSLDRSLDPLIGKIDLSCCDWLHRIGLPHTDQFQVSHPLDQSDEIKHASSTRSTPEISSLSDDRPKDDIAKEIAEVISLGSFPAANRAPETIMKLTDDEKENKEIDLLEAVGDLDAERKMNVRAFAVAPVVVVSIITGVVADVTAAVVAVADVVVAAVAASFSYNISTPAYAVALAGVGADTMDTAAGEMGDTMVATFAVEVDAVAVVDVAVEVVAAKLKECTRVLLLFLAIYNERISS
ncbi:hypothetical protein Aperf_G00000118287 [Anoplocephala perfoliata]